MIRRGAPFDTNNFFNIPPVDAGELNPGYVSKVARIFLLERRDASKGDGVANVLHYLSSSLYL